MMPMRSLRRLACLLLAVPIIAVVLAVTGSGAGAGAVRPAAVAGTFYPGRARSLRATVEDFLAEASPKVPNGWREAGLRALIVPHAGYVYSGRTAAVSYKLLEGIKKPSRVILLGPPHRAHIPGACSVADFSHYATPLGRVEVDAEARKKLVRSEPFRAMRRPHEHEHCLEVQLPFLQVIWPEPPKIVPILVGQIGGHDYRAAAAGIARILDEDTLIVVSTDFTHYGARFGFAPFRGTPSDQLRAKIRELDMGAVRHIEALDPAGFRQYQAQTGATICGRAAVSVMLELFSQAGQARAEFLQWTNSGEVTGSYSDCVSYVALAVWAPSDALPQIKKALPAQVARGPRQGAPLQGAEEPGVARALTDEHKRMLLKLARQSIETRLAGREAAAGAPAVGADEMPEALRGKHGAFVTLKKNGELRGCIGHIVSNQPLYLCVREVARLAALSDPRFPPLEESELGEITIAISVMSPPKKVESVQEIEVGRDGLIISKGGRRGLLLPQVAAEYGWGREEFLKQTCRKAGLAQNAYKSDDAEVYKFQAIIFGE
ncbi:MAG: AmmeMemoRadiSam system protein B [Candidatus Brocadiae bacterium]|nr:AmmeMemoRadiSam system protein B [Candidatus Brocadiia bacterium]